MTKELDEFELRKTEARAVTGVLASHPNSTDVHISSLSLTFHGQELLADTSLELNSGRRYGLIGLNGTGQWLLLAHSIHSCSVFPRTLNIHNKQHLLLILIHHPHFIIIVFLQENPCCCQPLGIVRFPFQST